MADLTAPQEFLPVPRQQNRNLRGESSPDVSIVIVSWNTRDILRKCLRSVFDETQELSIEVFVIDNNSCDGSAAMVCAEFPVVKLIENQQNRGFAAGCNQGIRAASGRYILLLNPDTVILDAAICRSVKYADGQPDVGVVGCQVLDDDQRIASNVVSFPTPFNLFLELSGLSRAFLRSRLFGRPHLGWWGRDSERDVDVVAGMFMLVRRKAINQVGLLDEAFFLYYEETDWCYRFAQSGWRRVFIPSARIIHLDGGGKSTSQISIKMFVQMQKSAMIYHSKNGGRIASISVRIIYIASNIVRMVMWFIFSMMNGDSHTWRKSVAAMLALRYLFLGVEPE